MNKRHDYRALKKEAQQRCVSSEKIDIRARGERRRTMNGQKLVAGSKTAIPRADPARATIARRHLIFGAGAFAVRRDWARERRTQSGGRFTRHER
jgi:hypothetical protein